MDNNPNNQQQPPQEPQSPLIPQEPVVAPSYTAPVQPNEPQTPPVATPTLEQPQVSPGEQPSSQPSVAPPLQPSTQTQTPQAPVQQPIQPAAQSVMQDQADPAKKVTLGWILVGVSVFITLVGFAFGYALVPSMLIAAFAAQTGLRAKNKPLTITSFALAGFGLLLLIINLFI